MMTIKQMSLLATGWVNEYHEAAAASPVYGDTFLATLRNQAVTGCVDTQHVAREALAAITGRPS